MDDDDLTVDDLVTGRAAEQLGAGRIPTHAVLIVETMSEEGPGLRFVRSQGCPVWTAMGLVRSALNRIELEDQDGWEGDED